MDVNSDQIILHPLTTWGAPYQLLPTDVFVTQLNMLLFGSIDSMVDFILIFSEIVFLKPFCLGFKFHSYFLL